MRRCPNAFCRHDNLDTASYCARCGTALDQRTTFSEPERDQRELVRRLLAIGLGAAVLACLVLLCGITSPGRDATRAILDRIAAAMGRETESPTPQATRLTERSDHDGLPSPPWPDQGATVPPDDASNTQSGSRGPSVQALTASPTRPSTPTFTSAPTRTSTPTLTSVPPTPTVRPSDTAEPPTEPPPTSVPEAEVYFWADRATIGIGESTVLHWDVRNVREVYLNGNGVVGQGSVTVSPRSTTRYDLCWVDLRGNRNCLSVVIEVRPVTTGLAVLDESPTPGRLASISLFLFLAYGLGIVLVMDRFPWPVRRSRDR